MADITGLMTNWIMDAKTKEPVRCEDPISLAANNDRQILHHEIDDHIEISTVFLLTPIPDSSPRGELLFYETMIFCPEWMDEYLYEKVDRYKTVKEARQGHDRMLREVFRVLNAIGKARGNQE